VTAADLRQSEAKPRPEFPGLGVDANWTHSGDVCVLAYSFDCQVGVDLERFRKRDLKIAQRFFHEEEVAYLMQMQAEGNSAGLRCKLDENDPALETFYDLWCRKEAYFKCFGGDFFEGTLKTCLLGDSVNGVHLKKMNPEILGIQNRFGFCLATMAKVSSK